MAARSLEAQLRLAVLYNRPAKAGDAYAASSRDVIAQVESVSRSLMRNGHKVTRLEVAGDLPRESARLKQIRPDAVFNLVESINDDQRLVPAAAGVFEIMGIPFTGSGSFALAATTDKHLAKLALRGAGLATPPWRRYSGEAELRVGDVPKPWIVKPVLEDASVGIEDGSIYEDESSLLADLAGLQARHRGQPLLVEQYLEGREFNLSLVAGGDGLEVLPPAEIDFSAFPPDKPRIVGYRAKWEEDSFEYRATPRVFRPRGEPLIERLAEMALAACDVFGMRGYCRVDFRVPPDGEPRILEVNANPCLSPDGGFMAAAAQAGLSADETVSRILAAALRHRAPGC